jgi:hypothetical protein
MEKEKNIHVKKIYVAYWVDLHHNFLKESSRKILGVFTTEEQAKLVCDNYKEPEPEYSKDDYFTSYEEIPLNKDVSYDEFYI